MKAKQRKNRALPATSFSSTKLLFFYFQTSISTYLKDQPDCFCSPDTRQRSRSKSVKLKKKKKKKSRWCTAKFCASHRCCRKLIFPQVLQLCTAFWSTEARYILLRIFLWTRARNGFIFCWTFSSWLMLCLPNYKYGMMPPWRSNLTFLLYFCKLFLLYF